jgi:hypothetical protein
MILVFSKEIIKLCWQRKIIRQSTCLYIYIYIYIFTNYLCATGHAIVFLGDINMYTQSYKWLTKLFEPAS